MPGVVQGGGLGPEENQAALFRHSVRQLPQYTVFRDEAAADQPPAVGGARGPCPAAIQDITIAVDFGFPHRREHTADNGIGGTEDLTRQRRRQIGRRHAGGGADHHAPANGSVRRPGGFDRPQHRRRCQLQPAGVLRYGHPEQARRRPGIAPGPPACGVPARSPSRGHGWSAGQVRGKVSRRTTGLRYAPWATMRILPCVLQDHVGRLLGDHDGRRVGIARHQVRHDGRIDHAQAFDAAHA